MDSLEFEKYKDAKARGLRDKAKTHLHRFIESFRSVADRKDWTARYLEAEFDGHKIRTELYEGVIFPVLLAGYTRRDSWCLRWLATTSQNLYQNHALWKQINFKSSYQLRRELLDICPESHAVKRELLSELISHFEYYGHEWPAGILYGADGASVEECDLILEDIELARRLDEAPNHFEFLIDFEAKVQQYRGRLIEGTKTNDGRL